MEAKTPMNFTYVTQFIIELIIKESQLLLKYQHLENDWLYYNLLERKIRFIITFFSLLLVGSKRSTNRV